MLTSNKNPTLGSCIGLVVLTVAAALAGTAALGNGATTNMLRGSSASETLRGTVGADRIRAGAGADRVFGFSGNDRLFGERGNDRLFGGRGNDRLYGGQGGDRMIGGPGSDALHGGFGNDRVLEGNSGDDRIIGGPGNDVLRGGPGDDVLYGGAGDDLIYGGGGDDVIVGGEGRDVVYAGSGNDLVDIRSSDSRGDSARCGAGAKDRLLGELGPDGFIHCETLILDGGAVRPDGGFVGARARPTGGGAYTLLRHSYVPRACVSTRGYWSYPDSRSRARVSKRSGRFRSPVDNPRFSSVSGVFEFAPTAVWRHRTFEPTRRRPAEPGQRAFPAGLGNPAGNGFASRARYAFASWVEEGGECSVRARSQPPPISGAFASLGSRLSCSPSLQRRLGRGPTAT